MWKSRWYAGKDYADLLHEDVRCASNSRTGCVRGVSSIDIERAANKLVIRIYTGGPGIIIGRKGAEIDKLKAEIQQRTKREVHIDIQEVHRPELDAQRVAESITLQPKNAWLSARDAQGRGFCAAFWMQRHQGACGRTAETAPKSRARNGICRVACRCRPCARTLITVLRQALPTYGVIGVKCGCIWASACRIAIRANASATSQRRKAGQQRNGSRNSYVDAEESEVPQAAARAPQRQGLARRKAWLRWANLGFERRSVRLDYTTGSKCERSYSRVAITLLYQDRGGKCGSGFFRTTVHQEAGRKPAWARAREYRRRGWRW